MNKIHYLARKILSGMPVKNQEYGLRILTYHRVEDSNHRLNVLPVTFRHQMRFLRQNSYKTLTLYEAWYHIVKGIRCPDKSVVITFDDGYKNNFTHAFPCLQEYGHKAEVFLIADSVGKAKEGEQMLTWDEIKIMFRQGIDFGSHALSHSRLTKIPAVIAREEIVRSKDILEQSLGKKVDFFCYPKGDYNPSVREMVKDAGYLGACSTEVGINDMADDVYCMRRTEISRFDDLDDFAGKLAGKFDCMHKAYQIYSRLKTLTVKVTI